MMTSSVMAHIRNTARRDVRLFLAPFVGAIEAVKREANRKSTKANKAQPAMPNGKEKTR
jgi:hypothetical protein